ncbi:hypothetical protein [Fibrella aquatilis]|uniref:Outer membrane lipoprotein-sorting protein n=1 Tax=Fibrella aquatilis TaxID=2817059 RepID=A0A939GBB4_9BACT|nr:hypothetical protein [Fibrella aquatilis]MBO0933243.1 hypothetical protein [Fibrella aquatilis]
MKLNVISLLTLLSWTAFFCVSAQTKSTEKEAINILQRVSNKLQNINNINYAYYRDVNYKSEEYHNEIFGSTYLKFNPSVNVTGFVFQLESDADKKVYDGTTFFDVNKKTKIMHVKKQPTVNDFSSLSFFHNSLITLRKAIPIILAEHNVVKTAADTSINKIPCYLISFTLDSQVIKNLGELMPLTSQRLVTYRIIIDKKTNLPIEVIQTNSITPQDYVLTRFSNYKINSDAPSENTWHYFNYIDQYKSIIKN